MHLHRFSVNASKWQVAFIEKQDDKVSIHMYNVTNLTHKYTVARACVICILKIRLKNLFAVLRRGGTKNGLRGSYELEGQRVISSQFWCLKLMSWH